MKKLLAPLIVLLGATSAFAQSNTGVTVSTDPARAEAVERHAQMLQARPAAESMAAPKSSAKSHGHHDQHHHGDQHQKKS
jgi:hypothetical protein